MLALAFAVHVPAAGNPSATRVFSETLSEADAALWSKLAPGFRTSCNCLVTYAAERVDPPRSKAEADAFGAAQVEATAKGICPLDLMVATRASPSGAPPGNWSHDELEAAIEGCVVGIGAPALTDYKVRAQVTAGLRFADPIKSAVSRHIKQSESFPDDRAALGLPGDPHETYSDHVQSVDVDRGTIVIVFGPDAHAHVADRRVTLTPHRTAAGDVIWSCGRGAAPPAASVSAKSPVRTNIPAKFLPQACR